MLKTSQDLDLNNIEIAFAIKSDGDLKRTAFLFSIMNKPMLSKIASFLGFWTAKLRIPIGTQIIKNTIFKQFCGGENLLSTQKNIDHLASFNALTILDYGAEAKESERDYDITMNEIIRCIDFGSLNEYVPVVSAKVTGIARFGLLEKLSTTDALTQTEEHEYKVVLKRLDAMCYNASSKKVGLFIDAEESWIQKGIDDLVDKMMARYNKGQVIVYNTFQMYRNDRAAFLKASHDTAKKEGYLLGAKLVRGAYMEKERKRAIEMGYDSPIHVDKAATDQDYDQSITYCLENYLSISFCNASHNQHSTAVMAAQMDQMGIPRNHPHVNFCQLFGMSDNITFNLAASGFNVAKYMPYGPVRDVIPYLVRRAQENSSVSGDMSREYKMYREELHRRGLD